MSLLPSPIINTVEQYLDLERSSEQRHEYLDGQIYAMAGESQEHGTICTNLGGQLYNQLRGKPCQVFSKDMKVRSGPTPTLRHAAKGLYSYPDLVVVCGELEFHDGYRDVLLNPAIIIEVLSTTTEAFDRGEKWARYQTWLPSLSDYVLVSQAAPMIEHFQRQPDDRWLYASVKGLAANLYLSSIDCPLMLADVYDRITFPNSPQEDIDAE